MEACAKQRDGSARAARALLSEMREVRRFDRIPRAIPSPPPPIPEIEPSNRRVALLEATTGDARHSHMHALFEEETIEHLARSASHHSAGDNNHPRCSDARLSPLPTINDPSATTTITNGQRSMTNDQRP
jgi:hypothetical protein